MTETVEPAAPGRARKPAKAASKELKPPAAGPRAIRIETLAMGAATYTLRR